jgi:hypothetical protein
MSLVLFSGRPPGLALDRVTQSKELAMRIGTASFLSAALLGLVACGGSKKSESSPPETAPAATTVPAQSTAATGVTATDDGMVNPCGPGEPAQSGG